MERKRIAVYSGPRNVSGGKVISRLVELKTRFATIGKEDLVANDLGGYSAIVFPGGHSVQAGKKGDTNVRDYVRGGGGFLGICAGLHYAVDLGLLDVDLMYVRGGGHYRARVIKRHPVTAGYKLVLVKRRRHERWSPVKYSSVGRVVLRRGNGGLIVPGKKVDVLVTYDDADTLAAVVAGTYGKGRVALFSPHPESSDAPTENSEEQDGFRLLVNALRFVSRAR